ncbi:MAG TPA: PT domain-containing protein, partial [Thermomicrobiales bacterium]|nr:PT domain-containing protein [Thermomicrobiales bacterium]
MHRRAIRQRSIHMLRRLSILFLLINLLSPLSTAATLAQDAPASPEALPQDTGVQATSQEPQEPAPPPPGSLTIYLKDANTGALVGGGAFSIVGNDGSAHWAADDDGNGTAFVADLAAGGYSISQQGGPAGYIADGSASGVEVIAGANVDVERWTAPVPVVDTDGDGIPDNEDPTPNGDIDGDGIDNLADPTPNGDSDADGVDELADNCVAVANPDQLDSDADGIGDACDNTPNGDPTAEPTVEPTVAPTEEPTQEPTVAPTDAPKAEPTTAPTVAPTTAPKTQTRTSLAASSTSTQALTGATVPEGKIGVCHRTGSLSNPWTYNLVAIQYINGVAYPSEGHIDHKNAAGDPDQWSIYFGALGDCPPVTQTPPQLSIAKTPDGATVSPGGTVTFTITVSNTGGFAQNVVITDNLPAGFTWTEGVTPCSISGTTLTCNTPVGGNGSYSVAVSAPVPATGVCGPITNTASFSYTGTNPQSGSDSGSVNVVCTTEEAPTLPTITDSSCVDLVYAAPKVAAPASTTGLTYSAVAATDNGASVTFTYSVTTKATFVLPATLPAGYTRVSNTNATYSKTLAKAPCSPALTLEKSVSPATVSVPGNVTYSFLVTNSGDVTLNNIVVNDPQLGATPIQVGTLAPQASKTVTAPYAVTQQDIDTKTQIVNTATAKAGSVASDPDSATVTITKSPALSITKTADVTSGLAVDDVVTYTITATNSGNVTLTGVTVADPKVSDLSCDPATPATIAPNASVTCTATHTITQADVDAGSFANTATADSDQTGEQTASVTVTTVDPSGALSLTKDAISLNGAPVGASRIDASVGDEIIYKLVATNTGNVTLSNVSIVDSLVGTLDCVQPVNLAPGATLECEATYAITQDDIDRAEVVNTANASGTFDGEQVPSNQASETVFLLHKPDIDLDKSGVFNAPTEANPLGTITYSFVVTNDGNVTLTGVYISDPLLGSSPIAVGTLAPAASQTVTATYVVTQADTDRGVVENVAEVRGFPPQDDSVSDDSDATVAIPQNPVLTITKVADVDSGLEAGDVVTYTITVANAGNVTLTNVTVSDPSVTDLACDPAALASIAVGGSVECTATHTITQDDVDTGAFVNTATADSDQTDPRSATETVTTAEAAPALSLTKAATALNGTTVSGDITDAELDDVVTYTFVATNTGNVTLGNVAISDPLPGLSTLSCAPVMPAELAPNGSVTCTATYTITQDDVDAGQVDNTATAAGTFTGAAVDAIPASETVRTLQSPALELVKSAPGIPAEGVSVNDTITYQFVVTNSGNVTLHNVVLSDPMTGLTWADPDPRQIGTLAPNASTTITATYTVTQADVNNGEIGNTATVDSDESGPTTDSETVSTNSSASLSLVKNHAENDTLTAGSTVDYTFIATNTGTTTLSGVTITDTSLPGMSALSFTLNGAPVTAPVTLQPNEQLIGTATYVVQQADVNAGFITNTANASGQPPQGDPVTSTDTDRLDGTRTASFEVSKDASQAAGLRAGGEVTYTYSVRNTGNVTLTNVTVTDDKIAAGEIDCGDGTNVIASLAPNSAAVECTATITITQAFIDAAYAADPDATTWELTNIATFTATPPQGMELASKTATKTISGPLTASASLAKSASPESGVTAGDTVTYSFAVTNTGTVTLTGVVIDDQMLEDAGVVIPVVGTLAPGASKTVSATYTVSAEDVEAGRIDNVAFAHGNELESPHDDATVLVDQAPGLALTKTAAVAGGTAALGKQVTYTLLVENTGDVTLTNIVVTDPLPGLSAVDCAPAIAGSQATIAALAPHASVECTATYTIGQDDVNAGRIDNTATARTTFNGQQVSANDSETVTIARTPALTLTKDATHLNGAPVSGQITGAERGDVVTYTFVARNTGNVTLTGATISDPLAGLSALACAPAAPATLAPGATLTCTATYTITQADVDARQVVNTATASGRFGQTNVAADPASETVKTLWEPEIHLHKKGHLHEPDAEHPLGTIHYTLEVTNTGNTTLRGVRVADELLSDDEFVYGTLVPGQAKTISAEYVITQQDIDNGVVHNHAYAHGQPPSGPQVRDDDSYNVNLEQNPGLTIEKSASTPAGDVTAGTVITYTFTVTNSGNVTVKNIVVEDVLGGLVWNAANPGGAVGTLAPKASKTITATYTVTGADVEAGNVHNEAFATGDGPTGDVTSDPDDADVPVGQQPGLTIQKTASTPAGTVTAGTVITYRFLVTNSGDVTVRDIAVTDELPGLVWNAANANGVVGNLAPGASKTISATYTVTAADVEAGNVHNSAIASGEGPGCDVLTALRFMAQAEDCGVTSPPSETDTPVDQAPGLAIDKSASPSADVAQGERITYTFTV